MPRLSTWRCETLNNAANHKILIILTDGENLEGDAVKAAENAAKAGLTIYTVGVGTSQGELIPIAAESGKGFVKDQDGNFVTSRLDETTLSAIAEKSGGLYVPLGTAGEGLETIYQQKLALIPKDELAERRHKVPLERFEWPLAAALFCLILELLIGERKNGRRAAAVLYQNDGLHWFNADERRKRQRYGDYPAAGPQPCASKAYCSKGEEAYASKETICRHQNITGKNWKKHPDDPQLLYNYRHKPPLKTTCMTRPSRRLPRP